MSLAKYRKKRDFEKTAEPRGSSKRTRKGASFVIQKHAATRLHYDFRLELDGVLKSWAVPKGPSLDPAQKRLAVEVEDHPLEYGSFEGSIPEGEYGGGQVILWDRGSWTPLEDAHEGLRKGRLKFSLSGEKLSGAWMLVRIRSRDGDRKNNWLLIKERDSAARSGAEAEIVELQPESVESGRTISARPSKAERARLARLGKDPRSDASPEARGERIWHSARGRAGSRASSRDPSVPGAHSSFGSRPGPRGAARERRLDVTSVAGARKAALPSTASPELATLVSVAPSGDDWVHEIKYDGYRLIVRIDRGRVTLWTRSGQDWTSHFVSVAEAAAELPVRQAHLDGEVVVLDSEGVSSFQALQNHLKAGDLSSLVFFAFDLLYLDGYDLTRAALVDRKALLSQLIGPASKSSVIRYSDHVVGNGPRFHAEACRHGLEGIIAKRASSRYAAGRGRDWLKIKCSARQELVIGGYSDPQGSRAAFGALLLGVYEGKSLKYAGRVGTGFTSETLSELGKKLAKLETSSSPFVDAPRMRDAHWVKPSLVAEVAFTGWTNDGKLRHPSFQGLREDKAASKVHRERAKEPLPRPRPVREPDDEPKAPPAKEPPKRRSPVREPLSEPPAKEPPSKRPPVREPPVEEPGAVAGVALSNPAKVLYPEVSLTKRDLALYMESVADLMVPQVVGRPLMLKRCPNGWEKPCFFQKHPGDGIHGSLDTVEIEESKGRAPYLVVRDTTGLVALVQMGALEVHVWGSRAEDLERPDRMVFDLDPAPEVAWTRVVDAAKRLRDVLAEFELESFVKTTGGKGLHIIAPLRPRASWEDVRAFSAAIAGRFVREKPAEFTDMMSKARRTGRIFIDVMRNGRGATWVAPYSMRAREGAPVSTPIAWSEVTARLDPQRFTVPTLAKRLRSTKDPWKGIDSQRQSLTQSMLREALET